MFVDPWVKIAKPVNTSPSSLPSKTVTALPASTLCAQPEMVPPVPSKRNVAGALTPFLLTTKLLVVFATVPVGAEAPPALLAGMLTTTAESTLPLPSYSVDLLLAWSATQTSVPGAKAIPQPCERLGSCCPVPGMFESKAVTVYALVVVGGGVGFVGAGAGAVDVAVPVEEDEPFPPPQPASANMLVPAISHAKDDRNLSMPLPFSDTGQRLLAFTQR